MKIFYYIIITIGFPIFVYKIGTSRYVIVRILGLVTLWLFQIFLYSTYLGFDPEKMICILKHNVLCLVVIPLIIDITIFLKQRPALPT